MKQVKDEMKMIRKENIDNFLVTDQEIKQRESERRARQKALHHVKNKCVGCEFLEDLDP